MFFNELSAGGASERLRKPRNLPTKTESWPEDPILGPDLKFVNKKNTQPDFGAKNLTHQKHVDCGYFS